ncbi:hypothetical protein QVD17_20890 [Tagetes erecta]|uniref:B3 domain-containing protein n=1 Tax=Tagetes erecta TaxID=13708 RepID=A0AAD8NYD5_TARER|nr:hypothetical protein QVD17_20890 [Tagetes erecta]
MACMSFDQVLTSEDDPARRSKRKLTSEDIHYLRKLEVFGNKILAFYQEKLREAQAAEERLRLFIHEKRRLREEKTMVIKNKRLKIISENKLREEEEAMAVNERLTIIRENKLREEHVKKPKSTIKSEESTSSGQKKRKPPKKFVRGPIVSNEITERLKDHILNEKKGTDLKLVIQKNLYPSDTKQGQNRLSMPINQLETNEFLSADEKRILNNKVLKENEIEVLVMDGVTFECVVPMKLTMWHMASTVNYVLKTRWYEFWLANKDHLLTKSKIQVWSFRQDEKLCFAVVCVEKPVDEDDA